VNPAIIYLAQNTPRDSQYGRDSRTMLVRSLDLLYENYNDRFGHQIIIFHEGDFSSRDQAEIAAGRSEIRFEAIRFDVPDFLRTEDVPEVWRGFHQFGMGHRHMCRFYSLELFDILDSMGIDWYFRMDDDSFLHSPIRYDLFEFMERNGHEYGYRVDVQDGVDVTRGFGESVLAYLIAEDLEPESFYEHMTWNPGLRHWSDRSLNALKNTVKTWINRREPTRPHLIWTWPSAPGRLRRAIYDRKGYYNNFHITRVGFWKSPAVQRFLHHFDRIGGAYRHRWNDLVYQSAAVQIFCPKSRIHKFTDWTYEHATVRDGRLFFGGIYEGDDDPDSEAVRAFRKKYGRTHTRQTW
jgi:alpha 1,2-mannosyltransferase